MPPPPGSLGAEGKALWESLGSDLLNSGVLTSADLPAFQKLCQSHDTAARLYFDIIQDGEIPLARGIEKNPALYRAYKAENEFCRKLLESFGASPRSRNSISGRRKEEETPDTRRMKELLGIV